MPKDLIATRLRNLRREASKLNSTLIRDLAPFHAGMGVFRRLPTSAPPSATDANASTSCTAIMALCSHGVFDEFFKVKGKAEELPLKRREVALTTLGKLMKAEWTSSGLPHDNAFTTTMILRTAGFLADNYKPEDICALKRTWSGVYHSLTTIARQLATGAPDLFELDESLRPNPALGYWLVDGIDKLNITLEAKWNELSRWATSEFARQFSLVTAHDDAIMDPIAMAMAACLAARLHSIASRPGFKYVNMVKKALPTRKELESGIELLFDRQETSGIWDKFFPMFYYKDVTKPGGANYCFAFEFLEAILNEFGLAILAKEKIVTGFERALNWCKEKRLQYSHNNEEYRGWNSAQQLDTVQVGMPESWATAVVHMFLKRLQEVLSEEIQRQILVAYNAKFLQARPGEDSLWDKFISPNIEFADGKEDGLKGVVEKEIIAPCKANASKGKEHLLVQDRPRQTVKLKHRRSALLFGPPGTSKTTLVEAVAENMEWPFVEITPSDFLREGLGQIYEEANRIFEDLMDLSGVVVLFDEMDALVQRRGTVEGRAQLDVTRQFLTTSMLPKLAKLSANAQVVFFMATNHRREFDEAILRPGRFDLLLCMGPPPWSAKKTRLEDWISKSEDDREDCTNTISEWVDTKPSVARMLDFFTFGEMKELFDYLRREYGVLKNFLDEEKTRKFDRLERIVRDWYEKMITLREGTDNRIEFDQYDRRASRIQ